MLNYHILTSGLRGSRRKTQVSTSFANSEPVIGLEILSEQLKRLRGGLTANSAPPDGVGSRRMGLGGGGPCSFQLRCRNIIRTQSQECRLQTPGPAKEPKGAGHTLPLPPHRLVQGWAEPTLASEQCRARISNGSQDGSSSPALSRVHMRREESAFGSDAGLSPASAAHWPCGLRQISYHSEPRSARS